MKKKKNKLWFYIVALALVGCSTTPSIQEYYVSKSEDPNFLVIDIPTSILGIDNNSLSQEEEEALSSFQKLNVLLFRKTVANEDEMIPTEFDHTIYEVEGDIQDLATVKNSELLDKKVVKRKSEATLIMDKEMSIQEELVEYMTYILEINPDKIPDIIGTYNDYTTNVEMG